jgi:hypothetical protein
MTDTTISAMTPQLAQAYKDATDNLMYLKKEQVQITYYTWALLAALYLISKNQDINTAMKAVLAVGSLAVGGFSSYIIWSFHRSMAAFRRRLRHIYKTFFDEEQRRNLGLNADDHYSLTILLIAVCLIASVFTVVLILSWSRIMRFLHLSTHEILTQVAVLN